MLKRNINISKSTWSVLKTETEERKVHFGDDTCHTESEVTQNWFQTFCPMNPAAGRTLHSFPFRMNVCTGKTLCPHSKVGDTSRYGGKHRNGFLIMAKGDD